MPVTHGVTGSSPVRTAINIDFQYFTKQAPNFTPENVKLGVCFEFEYFLVGMSFFWGGVSSCRWGMDVNAIV